MVSQRPNIVFIFPDQLRADFLSCYGAQFIDTANIDSIARRGVRYDRAYSASPLCVPARVALMTGMNAVRNGVTDNMQAIRADHEAVGIHTWPQILASVGYYTAAVGKMHFYPWDASLGFQYRVIAEDKRWVQIRDDYYHFLKDHGLAKLHGNEHEGYFENKGAIINRLPWDYSVDRFVGQEACRFIRNYGKGDPFALMIGFPGPHCPYDPSPDFPETFEPADMPDSIPEVPGDTPQVRARNIEGNKRPWNGVDYTEFTEAQKKKIRAHYAGSVKQIDHEVGEIIESLREAGQLENTVIVFASDHGDYLGDHNLIGKGSFYESAIRIPLIVSVPEAQQGGVSRDLVECRDITATILGLAGVDVPAHMDSIPLPGLDLTDLPPRDRIFGMLTDGWMVFDGEWKLAKYATGEVVMFNLNDDPYEQRNLAEDPNYADVYRRLDAELTRELMDSNRFAMHDRTAMASDLSQDPGFGREGWQRPYPAPVDFVIGDER